MSCAVSCGHARVRRRWRRARHARVRPPRVPVGSPRTRHAAGRPASGPGGVQGQYRVGEQVPYDGREGGEAVGRPPRVGNPGEQGASGAGPGVQRPQARGELGCGAVGTGRVALGHVGEVARQGPEQVGRAQPDALTELGEPEPGQLGAQFSAFGGAAARGGDDDHLPVAVPGQGLGVDGVVLASLAFQQPVAEPVDRVGAPQVTGRHHPAERGPHGGPRDPERLHAAHELLHRQLGRMQTQQQAQDDRPGGQRAQVRLPGRR